MDTQALALLADFTNPDLSEVAIAERHALTLDDLRARSAAPAFRRALAVIAEIRETRRPLLIANAESRAAQALTALAERAPTSASAAREIRLAIKDLLALLTPVPPSGAEGFQPSDRPRGDAPSDPASRSPLRADGGLEAPRSTSVLPGATACSQTVSHPTPSPSSTPDTPEPPSESGGVGAPAPTPQTNHPRPTQQPADRPKRAKPKRPRGTKPRPRAVSR